MAAPAKSSIHQFSVDTEGNQEDLPGVMEDRDGWERELGISVLSVQVYDDMVLSILNTNNFQTSFWFIDKILKGTTTGSNGNEVIKELLQNCSLTTRCSYCYT